MGSKAAKEYPESDLLFKAHCPACREKWPDSSDEALGVYSDGHSHCFVCGTTFRGEGPAEGGESVREADDGELAQVLAASSHRAISSRGLTTATVTKWDYRVRLKPNGDYEQLATVRDPASGAPIAIHVRNTGKDGTGKAFYWIGDSKVGALTLWGRHMFPAGGKRLTILGGEIDCMTVSQAYSHKWAVASVLNGEGHAAATVRANLEYINSFDEVVLGFDMDETGRKACVECAALLPPGKAKIAKWASKDPNQAVLDAKGDTSALTLAIHTAEVYRPDGLVDARTLTAACLTPRPLGRPWPWRSMTKWTYGRRYGELYTFGAGSGVGKTDGFGEIIANTIQGTTTDGHVPDYAPESWGIFAFEGGGPVELKKRIAGKIASRRFHLPPDPDHPEWTQEEFVEALAKMDGPIWNAGGQLWLNDAKGATDWDSIKDRIRFLRHAHGVENFLVDPLSALVAGEEDERKMLDQIVLQYALLMGEIEATGYLASHLTRPKDGPGHEGGGQVRGAQFRGSNGILMYSDFVFGWERDVEGGSTETTARAVKDRLSGNSTGKTFPLGYDQMTGRLEENAGVSTQTFLGDGP